MYKYDMLVISVWRYTYMSHIHRVIHDTTGVAHIKLYYDWRRAGVLGSESLSYTVLNSPIRLDTLDIKDQIFLKFRERTNNEFFLFSLNLYDTTEKYRIYVQYTSASLGSDKYWLYLIEEESSFTKYFQQITPYKNEHLDISSLISPYELAQYILIQEKK